MPGNADFQLSGINLNSEAPQWLESTHPIHWRSGLLCRDCQWWQHRSNKEFQLDWCHQQVCKISMICFYLYVSPKLLCYAEREILIINFFLREKILYMYHATGWNILYFLKLRNKTKCQNTHLHGEKWLNNTSKRKFGKEKTGSTGKKERPKCINATKPGFHAMPFLLLANWQGFYSPIDPQNQSLTCVLIWHTHPRSFDIDWSKETQVMVKKT